MAKEKPDTVRLQGLAHAYWDTAVLNAAIELGLFTRVSEGADTVDKIAAALDIEPLNAHRLTTACATLDLLRHQPGGRFANAPDIDRFLVEGKPGYAAPWLDFTRKVFDDWPKWNRLADYLRRKGPPQKLAMYQDFGVEDARAYHEATYSIGLGAGRRFVHQVDLSKRRKILDLGGGSGCYCIAACTEHPHLRATVLDLPPVTEVAREFIAKHDLSARIDTLAGDFNETPFPTDADVTIMASNIPHFDRETMFALARKAFDALLPGGEMHIIGEILDDDGKGPVSSAMWALEEALYGGGGTPHSRAETREYLSAAGFVDVTDADFIPETLARVSGTKPA
ncbi:MAG: methyltransferase [Alphaproteobacteria bacterium]